MGRVARYGKAIAREGGDEELARLLLTAADGLADDAGCVLYLVDRQTNAPDIEWVTEVWRSQEDMDASIANIDPVDATAAMASVEDWEMIELELLGGKGPER